MTTPSSLPASSAVAPVPVPHFPDALHAVVWRNWELVELERLAQVLRATPDQIAAIAESMGLPAAAPISADLQRHSYPTVIRRNWHLLPYEQLLELLGWDAPRLVFTLREDDFLYHKCGDFKPACEPVCYAPPSPAARRRVAEIRRTVEAEFGDALHSPGEPRFSFLRELTEPVPTLQHSITPTHQRIELRFLYSYFAEFGDPLSRSACDPYPDGYLAQLAALGVNGVWLHSVLHKLVRWPLAPELADGGEQRLENLRQLIVRAARHGIGVYLYLNEPRAMPVAFFEQHPELRGVTEGDFAALCTSMPAVQQFLVESVAAVFRAVPDLAGVFTITMSENLTNCHSRDRGDNCPRCRARGPAAVVAEVNSLIAEGAWRAQPQARVIVWDWGWQDPWVEQVIAALPSNVWLMSVSEWSVPIERGGVRSAVDEYSMSVAGPGPRAAKHWAAARQRGMKTVAKVQINNTWELSAVPYIPVMELVAQHLSNLRGSGINGLMLGWTLGGYPSPNLEVAAQFYGAEWPTPQQAVETVARRRFGDRAAPRVAQAWQEFSAAFREFPFHQSTLYVAPQQIGPANLLYRQPTGFKATMIGFPYDDLNAWRAVYRVETFIAQFEKVAGGFEHALATLQNALPPQTAPHNQALAEELIVAEAAAIHFRSTANQARFIVARDALAVVKSADDAHRHWRALEEVLRHEIKLARRLYEIQLRDSRIGFEASSKYYYVPLDLAEKILNCRDLLNRWLPEQRQRLTDLP